MRNRLEDVTRRISQRLAVASTLLVAIEGPTLVSRFDRSGPSIWWTNVEGYLALANDPDQRDRFLQIDKEDAPEPSVPRPVQLVVFTAEAHAQVVAELSDPTTDLGPIAGLALRVAILEPLPTLTPAASGYRELSTDLLRIDGVQSVYSRTSTDDEIAVTSPANIADVALRGELSEDPIERARIEQLRDRNYIQGLMSRILRMQYEVDHFRLLAERALKAEQVAAYRVHAIRGSKRYKLALLGVRPLYAARKGAAKARGTGGSKAIGT